MKVLASQLKSKRVLFVDDEEMSCKWFARSFAKDFEIVTASSAQAAEQHLSSAIEPFAVVVCDHQMPHKSGGTFLAAVAVSHPCMTRVLVSAYVNKDMLTAAINQASIHHVIEKPWQIEAVAQVLHASVLAYQERLLQRSLAHGRIDSTRDTLGFLAHEINTPLSIAGAYLALLNTQLSDSQLGLITKLNQQLNTVKNILNSSVEAAKLAALGIAARPVKASMLVEQVLALLPNHIQAHLTIRTHVEHDFYIKHSSELIHLVLSSLLNNAVKVLTPPPFSAPAVGVLPLVLITLTHIDTHFLIRVSDNGPGIPPERLRTLSFQPQAAQEADGIAGSGSGMGLVFCRRVVESLSGELLIESNPPSEETFSIKPNEQMTTTVSVVLNEHFTSPLAIIQ
jgi:two-component system, response regulator PhcR